MNTSPASYWTPLEGQANYESFVNFYKDSTTFFLNDIKNIYGENIVIPVDTTVSVEPRKRMIKLKNTEGSWTWVKQENTILASMGFTNEAGNMTADTSSLDFFSITSVYVPGSNILKIASENATNLPGSASIGSGNSNPVLRIIYKTSEEVKAIVSSSIRFDGVHEDINYNAVFKTTESWDTLLISLQNLQQYEIGAHELVLENIRFLYPITASFRLKLDIKEIAYGAMDLIVENDILTGTNIYASSHRNKIIIYPNPAGNNVTVELPETNIERMFLYDNLGRCLKKMKVSKDVIKLEINVEDYKSGIYYVRVESDYGRESVSYKGLFIKN